METRKSIGMELRALNSMLMRKRSQLSPAHNQKDSVTMMHGRIVAYLFSNKDRDVFQRDIEQEFEIRKPTVTKILQTMEKNGLIIRYGVDYDARLKKIQLTEKAKHLHGEVTDRVTSFEETVTKGLTEEEIETFLVVVNKIKKNLE